MYTQLSASNRTNAQQSRPFHLHRETYQGCPLSPMLFNLAIEPLATAFHSCMTILYLVSGRMTQFHYMLVTCCFISNPSTSLPSALSLLRQFGQLSGYKLNLNKSELFLINEEANALDLTNMFFKIEKNKFSYLGVSITRTFKENFMALLHRTKQTLSQWSPPVHVSIKIT